MTTERTNHSCALKQKKNSLFKNTHTKRRKKKVQLTNSVLSNKTKQKNTLKQIHKNYDAVKPTPHSAFNILNVPFHLAGKQIPWASLNKKKTKYTTTFKCTIACVENYRFDKL